MRRVVWAALVACSSHRPVTTPATGDLVATTNTDIDGVAEFPPQHIDDPALRGKVADLTSEVDGDRNRWTLAIEDAANLRHTYSIELPSKVVFAIATGTTVLVEPEVTATPSATGHIAVSDEHGALVLAIGKLPAGWSAEATESAMRVREPGGAMVELVPTPWRSFTLADTKLVGNGSPTDFAIVRTR